MWYPSEQQTKELAKKLLKLQSLIPDKPEGVSDFLSGLSNALSEAAHDKTLPRFLLQRWIWIGSQFRIHGNRDYEIRNAAGSGMLFFIKSLPLCDKRTDIAEILWVTDLTMSLLQKKLGPATLSSFLSDQELEEVKADWLVSFPDKNEIFENIRITLPDYLKNFADIASNTYLPGISNKVQRLIDEVENNGRHEDTALAALYYLVNEHDIVPDELGYLGLVDDIYVVNSAYEHIEQSGLWRPMLEDLLAHWPQLATVSFVENDDVICLSPFLQLVCGVALDRLSAEGSRNAIILPEQGPVIPIIAFLYILIEICNSAREKKDAIDRLEKGDHVVLFKNGRNIRAIYDGHTEIDGKCWHFIKLNKSARVQIRPEHVNLLQHSSAKHNTLSSPEAWDEWKKDFTPDPLYHLTGTHINPDDYAVQILLVMAKGKAEKLFRLIMPGGYTLAELIGVKYFTKDGRHHDLTGTKNRTPMIAICSELSVAKELLSKTETEEPILSASRLIIDAAKIKNAEDVLGAIVDEFSDLNVMALVDSDTVWEADFLKRKNFTQILLKQSEFDSAGWGKELKTNVDTGAISQYLKRQAVHLDAEFSIEEIDSPILQKFSDVLRNIKSNIHEDGNSALFPVMFEGIALFRYLQGLILTPDEKEVAEIQLKAERLREFCSSARNYSEDADDLHEIVSKIYDEAPDFKAREFVFKSLPLEKDKEITIVCPCRTTAEKYSSRYRNYFQRVTWISVQELDMAGPFPHLVIPGWLGQNHMRRIRQAPPAYKVTYLFYGFENSEEERSLTSDQRREARIKQHFLDCASKLGERWTKITAKTKVQTPVPDNDDKIASETENLDEWASDLSRQMAEQRIRRNSDDSFAKAKLVLFEDFEFCAWLPPQGSVICLNNIDEADISSTENNLNSFDHLLLRPVKELQLGDMLAFPTDWRGDLLDMLGDELIDNPEEVRRVASLWKEALNKYATYRAISYQELSEELASSGLERNAQTIRMWMDDDHHTIAPRGWQTALPVIAEVTRYTPLKTDIDEVGQAIQKIYRARGEAAGVLLREIHASNPDLQQGTMHLQIRGKILEYRILKVRSVDTTEEVPKRLIGSLERLSAESLDDRQFIEANT